MFHIYGLTTLTLYQMRMGCQIVTLPKFTPELYINMLRNDKPHVLYVVPPIGKFLHLLFSAYAIIKLSFVTYQMH